MMAKARATGRVVEQAVNRRGLGAVVSQRGVVGFAIAHLREAFANTFAHPIRRLCGRRRQRHALAGHAHAQEQPHNREHNRGLAGAGPAGNHRQARAERRRDRGALFVRQCQGPPVRHAWPGREVGKRRLQAGLVDRMRITLSNQLREPFRDCAASAARSRC